MLHICERKNELSFETFRFLSLACSACTHPIALQRCVTSTEYTMPGTNIKMKKGDTMFINSPGIHSDPEYFPLQSSTRIISARRRRLAGVLKSLLNP